MRFADFLRVTVLLSAGSATALGLVTVIGATQEAHPIAIEVAVGWWALAAVLGLAIGRRAEASPPIARLLAGARAQAGLPELRPATTLLNRLWPLLVMTLGVGVLGFLQPQISGVAAGFAIVWALSWRRQHLAVTAIEQRDAARFYIDDTAPFDPIRLIRTPGFGGEYFRLEP